MYEAFLMYWSLWIIWIMIVFFMDNSRTRFFLSCWLLLTICLSSTYFYAGELKISVAIFVVLVGSLIYMVENTFSLLQLFRAFTIMIAYHALLIWEKLTPVWFFMPAYFIVPICMTMLALVVSFPQKNVFAYTVFGMTLGQISFDLRLSAYELHHEIGMVSFFIYVAFTMILLISIRTGLRLHMKITSYIQHKLI